MAHNLVRQKTSNIIEWIGEGFTFEDVATDGSGSATHFSIVERTDEWGLPANGWDYGSREPLTIATGSLTIPEDFQSGTTVLNGSDGSYTWA